MSTMKPYTMVDGKTGQVCGPANKMMTLVQASQENMDTFTKGIDITWVPSNRVINSKVAIDTCGDPIN